MKFGSAFYCVFFFSGFLAARRRCARATASPPVGRRRAARPRDRLPSRSFAAEPTEKSRGRPRGLRLIPRLRLAAVEPAAAPVAVPTAKPGAHGPAATPPSRHRRDPPRPAGSSSRTPPAAAPSP